MNTKIRSSIISIAIGLLVISCGKKQDDPLFLLALSGLGSSSQTSGNPSSVNPANSGSTSTGYCQGA